MSNDNLNTGAPDFVRAETFNMIERQANSRAHNQPVVKELDNLTQQVNAGAAKSVLAELNAGVDPNELLFMIKVVRKYAHEVYKRKAVQGILEGMVLGNSVPYQVKALQDFVVTAAESMEVPRELEPWVEDARQCKMSRDSTQRLDVGEEVANMLEELGFKREE